MGQALAVHQLPPAGIHIERRPANGILDDIVGRLEFLGVGEALEMQVARESGQTRVRLSASFAEWLMPGASTLELAKKLSLDPEHNPRDLEAEILLAMLGAPAPFRFTSVEELGAALRIRARTVTAAGKTLLDFKTNDAERPREYWTYHEGRGFLLRPDRDLIEALEQATQPSPSGHRYSFSCWRATEYVFMLAVALELRAAHPELLVALTKQARLRALRGGDFDRAFLMCHGSTNRPLPREFFVPGDRIWFRNPDRESSAIPGYEGSYTFYLGAGRFADFWKPSHAELLTTKCLTMFYWRLAIYRDGGGVAHIDEVRVAGLVARTLANPAEVGRILRVMLRIQDAPERFGGGCLDPTRDHVRQTCRGSSDLTFPDAGAGE